MLVHDRFLVHRDDGFRSWRSVAQSTVGPLRVVVFPPLFDDDLCLFLGVEDFAVKQFVPKTGIEAFTVSVLPWGAWYDVGGLSAYSFDPFLNGLGNELRAVVRSDEGWNATQDEQVRQHVYDVCRVELAVYPDCQTFTAMLVQNVQCPEDFSIVGSVMDKIIGPDVVAALWPQPHARTIIQPEPTFLRLFHRHFQPLTFP